MNPNVPSELEPRDIDPELQRIIQRAAPGARILRARPMGADDASRNGSVTAQPEYIFLFLVEQRSHVDSKLC
jgi:hypothetical protein